MTGKTRLYIKRALAILGFIALFVAVETVVDYFVLPLTNFNIENRRDRLASAGEITGAVLGASLVADGVDPALLDERLGGAYFNLGSNAQSVRFSYYGLLDMMSKNPIDRVLIEISVNRMSRDAEANQGLAKLSFSDYLTTLSTKFLYMRENYTLDDLPSVLLMSARCQLKFVVDQPSIRFQPEYIRHYLENGYGRVANSNMSYGGRGFLRYSNKMHQGGAGAEPLDPADAREVFTSAETDDNVAALARIIELCNANGVEVILFTVPCSDTWKLGYADSYGEAHTYFAGLAERFGLPYYDFNLSKPLATELTDEHFKDVKHMNEAGAEVFTKQLAQTLSEGYDPAQFYDSFEAALRDIDRVAGVSLGVVNRSGARYTTVETRMGPNVDAEYRYLLGPSSGGSKDDFQVIRDYGDEAELDLSKVAPGAHTLRVEARSKAHPEREFDAYATIKLS